MVDLPGEALDPSQWDGLRSAAASQNIEGLFAAAIRAGAFPATKAQTAVVMDGCTAAMGGCLLLEAALLDLHASLHRAGIPVTVLRGAATAHLDYPTPDRRSFSDIDVLVPRGMIEQASLALVEGGLTRDALPRPNGRWEPPELALTSGRALEIDLYDHVVAGPLASRLPAESLWSDRSCFELAGTSLWGLSPEGRLIAACLRVAAEARPRLIALRDVVQLVLGGHVDVELLHQLANEWGVRVFVAIAIQQAWDSFALADVVSLSTWARRHRPTAEEAALLDAYRNPAVDLKPRRQRPRRLFRSGGARAAKSREGLFR
jgi:hypothetical protein